MKTEIRNLTKHLGKYILLPFILLVIVLAVCGLLLDIVVEEYIGILLVLIVIAPFGLYTLYDNIKFKLFLLNYFLIFLILLILVEVFQVGSVIVVLFILWNLVYYFKKVRI